MKKLIKLPFKIMIIAMGLLLTALLFIAVLPISISKKLWKSIKRITEHVKRFFNCTINGYWIYF